MRKCLNAKTRLHRKWCAFKVCGGCQSIDFDPNWQRTSQLGDFTGWRRCCQHPQHWEVGALLALSAAQVPDTLCNTGWHFLGFPLHFLMSFMLHAFNFNENTKLSRACFVIKLLTQIGSFEREFLPIYS